MSPLHRGRQSTSPGEASGNASAPLGNARKRRKAPLHCGATEKVCRAHTRGNGVILHAGSSVTPQGCGVLFPFCSLPRGSACGSTTGLRFCRPSGRGFPACSLIPPQAGMSSLCAQRSLHSGAAGLLGGRKHALHCMYRLLPQPVISASAEAGDIAPRGAVISVLRTGYIDRVPRSVTSCSPPARRFSLHKKPVYAFSAYTGRKLSYRYLSAGKS